MIRDKGPAPKAKNKYLNKLSFDTSDTDDSDDLPAIDLNDNTSSSTNLNDSTITPSTSTGITKKTTLLKKQKRKNLPATKGRLDSSDDSCLDISDFDLCYGSFDPTRRSSSSEEDEPIVLYLVTKNL